MAITSSNSTVNRDVVITVTDRFDFSQYKVFRDCYRSENTVGRVFRVNLKRATYMDSSALGMLLLMKEHADQIKGKVIIEEPNDAINKVFEIAQFHQLMEVKS
ncbi:MAG: STAS domain-containing protein [Gammaproteobacteria bacterium]|nr:STAS domain-containing protein [Gammaproteobacteria bacterium]